MRSVLFLCHRLPWPPSKGDKIRSYHVLRRLAEHYRVYLGAFVDEPSDWQYLAPVEALCTEVCVRPLPPWAVRWRALASLVRGEPLTVGVYRDRVMQRWIEGLLAERKLDLALCYSSGVAPFVMAHPQLRRVMDFVDVDSDKWRQYAQANRGLKRLIYQREARRLAEFERTVATQFDASVLVSEAEAAFFRQQVPAAAGKIHGIPNGVDGEYLGSATRVSQSLSAGRTGCGVRGCHGLPRQRACGAMVRARSVAADFCATTGRPVLPGGQQAVRGGPRAGPARGRHGDGTSGRCAAMAGARTCRGSAVAHCPRHPEQGAGGVGHGKSAAGNTGSLGGHRRFPGSSRLHQWVARGHGDGSLALAGCAASRPGTGGPRHGSGPP